MLCITPLPSIAVHILSSCFFSTPVAFAMDQKDEICVIIRLATKFHVSLVGLLAACWRRVLAAPSLPDTVFELV